MLVSAGPAEVVIPVAEYLGVAGAICSHAEVDEVGRYTGQALFWAYGTAKVAAIRQTADQLGIELVSSWAYSDAISDLPMLEAVGHPVVVNPDRRLARAAQARGWERHSLGRPRSPTRWV